MIKKDSYVWQLFFSQCLSLNDVCVLIPSTLILVPLGLPFWGQRS